MENFTLTLSYRSDFYKSTAHKKLATNQTRRVEEDETPEFIGIINYAIMALIQLEKGVVEQT